jgi:hypothetical protein
MRRTPPKTRKAHRFTSNANFFNFLGSKPSKPSDEEIDEVVKGLKNVSNFKKLSNHSKLEKYQDMMTHLAAQNNAHTDLLDIVGRARIARDKERSRRRNQNKLNKEAKNNMNSLNKMWFLNNENTGIPDENDERYRKAVNYYRKAVNEMFSSLDLSKIKKLRKRTKGR